MFEQTIVTGGEKRPWTFLVSVSGQTLLAAMFVTLPLIYTDSITLLRNPAPPPILFRPVLEPRPVQPTAAAAPVASTIFRRIADTVFRAPSTIPPGIPTLADEPSPSIGEASPSRGPMGATDGVPGSLINATSAPPPVKRDPVVEKAPVPREPVPIGGTVLAAKLIKKVVPEYPVLARQARVSGTVRLLGVVAKDGTIQKLELVSGHALLAPAALNAVRQWIYRPTLLNGQPVEVQAPIDVIFTLGQ